MGRGNETRNGRGRSGWARAGLFFIVALAACCAMAVGAEPTASDLARELAALSGRVAELEWQRTLVLGVLGISALGLPMYWWAQIRKASRLADEKIAAVIESRPGALLQLITEHDREAKLRRESRVVILSDGLDLEAVLRQHGFSRVVSRPIGSEADVLAGAAAVVLDLRNADLEAARAFLQMHSSENVLAFTTGSGRVDLSTATFANSPITLFGRLYELLKFQEAKEKG